VTKTPAQLDREISDALKASADECRFDDLFTRLEAAIDAHPLLARVGLGGKIVTPDTPVSHIHEPVMSVRRVGYTVRVLVKLKGSRKKPSEITGTGETAEAAIDHLITGLDYWAQALE
jgi:hypothetical protein